MDFLKEQTEVAVLYQRSDEEGDLVLVRNLCERGGPGKIRSYWEGNVYRAVKRIEASPVYQVVQESSKDSTLRTLHCNLLLPCNDLPLDGQCVQRRKNQQRSPASNVRQAPPQASYQQHDDLKSESDDELFLFVDQPDIKANTPQNCHQPPTPRSQPTSSASPDLDPFPSPISLQGQSNPASPDSSFQQEMNTSSEVSGASPVSTRPQRIRRTPEALQYTHLGQPQSFPIYNSVYMPMLLLFFQPYPSRTRAFIPHSARNIRVPPSC